MRSTIFLCAAMFGANLVVSAPALAQNTSSPLFTTPAERSSTTVPILSGDGASDSGEIIEDIGGGRQTNNAPAPAAQTAEEAPIGDNVAPPPRAAVSAQPTIEFETSEIGIWNRECLPAVSVGPKCQIAQRVVTPDGNQVILVFSLAKAADDGQFQIQMAVPLGISIPEGIELVVGENYRSVLPVARCTAQGCIAEGIAAEAMLSAMFASPQANVVVRNADGTPIAIDLALSDFERAVASLDSNEVSSAVDAQ